jgi:cell pole-organizing protein PopZ
MSGAQSQPGPAGGSGGGDPSMEDILASIRRILSEDEAPPSTAADPPPHKPDAEPGEGVLVLDPAMMVQEPTPLVEETPVAEPPLQVEPVAVAPVATDLVAPEAAAAAATSVGSLVRTLAAERYAHVRTGGPTIEDLVREEIRALLKEWLDVHLPPLVERLVRTEIERVVGRAVP